MLHLALADIRKFDMDPAEMLRDPLNKELLQTLSAFARTLAHLGHDVRIWSKSSLKKLPQTSPEKKRELISYYKTWHQWVTPVAGTMIPIRLKGSFDKAPLQKVLDYYRFKVSDEFLETLTDDQLIEIYGQDMIQLYRSLSFFHICGYSLLDLSLHEWYVLWERPHRVNEAMGEYAKSVLLHSTPVQTVEIPRHILRETYDTGMTDYFAPRAILMEFLKIGSLHIESQRQPAGFICTSRARVVAEGEEALNIEFI